MGVTGSQRHSAVLTSGEGCDRHAFPQGTPACQIRWTIITTRSVNGAQTHRGARREALVVDAGGAQIVEAAWAERAVRAEDVARDQHVQHRIAQKL